MTPSYRIRDGLINAFSAEARVLFRSNLLKYNAFVLCIYLLKFTICFFHSLGTRWGEAENAGEKNRLPQNLV